MITTRLYYDDSYLTEFSAHVVETREEGRRVYLDRTPFYPASGGQPNDLGEIAGVPVADVIDEEKRIAHLLAAPVEGPGVTGRIDWPRRFDHMQQHTGQHLLSAVLGMLYGARTVGFHLGAGSAAIDLDLPSLGPDEVARAERRANEIAAENRPVTVSYEEAARATGLRRASEREGMLRIVSIADLDRSACGGTHVRSTGQIGGLLLRRIEKVSRGVRVEFVCGMRAVRAARADAVLLTEASALLSIGAPELPGAVRRLLAEARTGLRERQRLLEELALLEAAQLARETPLEDGLRLIVREWRERGPEAVRLLASRTAAAAPATAAIFSAGQSDPARVFVARSRDLNFDCGRILREALAQLGLRGGGSPDMAQGEVPARELAALRNAVAAAMRASLAAAEPRP
jgi:alanyl-tRNA synthetase